MDRERFSSIRKSLRPWIRLALTFLSRELDRALPTAQSKRRRKTSAAFFEYKAKIDSVGSERRAQRKVPPLGDAFHRTVLENVSYVPILLGGAPSSTETIVVQRGFARAHRHAIFSREANVTRTRTGRILRRGLCEVNSEIIGKSFFWK